MCMKMEKSKLIWKDRFKWFSTIYVLKLWQLTPHECKIPNYYEIMTQMWMPFFKMSIYPVLGCGWIWCCPQNMWRRSAGGRAECCSCSQCSCQQRGLPPPSWTTLILTQAKQINSFVCIFFGKYQSWIFSHKFKFEIKYMSIEYIAIAVLT